MGRLSFGLGLGPGAPRIRDPFAGASLVLDFLAGRYEIDGAPFDRSAFTTVAGSPVFDGGGLTVDGDDKLKLPNVGWFTPAEGTFLVDWRLPETIPIGGGIFSMRGGAGGTATRIEVSVGANARTGVLTLQAYDTAARVLTYNQAYHARPGRMLFTLKAGEKPRVCGPHATAGAAVSPQGFDWFAPSVAASEAGLGYRIVFNDWPFKGAVRRVVFWPRKLSDDELTAFYLDGDGTNLHLLGDSFATAAALAALHTALIEERRTISLDGVGGSSLAQQAARFAATPQYWDRTLLIIDGGLDDTAAAAIAAIDDMAGRLTHGRWAYMQPAPGPNAIGSPERATWDAAQAAIRAHVGEARYIETLPALQAAADGSANDLADVAAGLTPRSLRSDSVHETAAGTAIRMGAVAARLTALGW
jgi:hypothetical protein